jgi:hypothetical protein
MATTNLQGNYTAQGAVTQVKEIGLLTRIDGLHSGLGELRARLENFNARVLGHPTGASNAEQPRPGNVAGVLSEAEGQLRECLSLIGQINDTF